MEFNKKEVIRVKHREFSLIFVIFLGLILLTGCKSIFAPEDPDEPDEIQFYDYQLEYRRPAGSIVDVDGMMDPIDVILFLWHGNSRRVFTRKLTKQNDYLFTGRMMRIPGNSSIEMYVIDCKRWKETFKPRFLTWGNPHSVGDRFILKCEQTGFEKELLKIVKNDNFSDLPPNCDAYIAQCTVEADGSITDK